MTPEGYLTQHVANDSDGAVHEAALLVEIAREAKQEPGLGDDRRVGLTRRVARVAGSKLLL